jgi:retinol dehydrogenase-12
MILDLAYLPSVDTFVNEYKATKKSLHLLINNAGIMACPYGLTKDGFEMQFGVNHLGHFSLTMKLLPIIKSSSTAENPARIVCVSSIANYVFSPAEGIRLDDLKGETYYDPWERYGSSKLANVLFAKELNRRLRAENSSVQVFSLHPGSSSETNLGRHMGGLGNVWSLVRSLYSNAMFGTMFTEFRSLKSLEAIAATQLYCATSPDVVSGEYYSDCNLETQQVHPTANDENLAKELWKVSCVLTHYNERVDK